MSKIDVKVYTYSSSNHKDFSHKKDHPNKFYYRKLSERTKTILHTQKYRTNEKSDNEHSLGGNSQI